MDNFRRKSLTNLVHKSIVRDMTSARIKAVELTEGMRVSSSLFGGVGTVVYIGRRNGIPQGITIDVEPNNNSDAIYRYRRINFNAPTCVALFTVVK